MINSGPRITGKIAQMLTVIEESDGSESTVKIMHISDLSIKPCTAFLVCRLQGRCILPQDDGHAVLK
jgi:multimeric flavodoxin WrbA